MIVAFWHREAILHSYFRFARRPFVLCSDARFERIVRERGMIPIVGEGATLFRRGLRVLQSERHAIVSVAVDGPLGPP